MARWKQFVGSSPLGSAWSAGLVLSGFWPHTPLHAVATDRVDTFAMATGPLDSEVEAVYFLDFLTGDLTAVVLGKQPNSWTGFFQANVAADLGIDPQKNPKFLMVTGMANLRRGGGSPLQPSNAMCYVAEITSGKVAAYAVPVALDVCRRPAAKQSSDAGRRHPFPPSRHGRRARAATAADRSSEDRRAGMLATHANHC